MQAWIEAQNSAMFIPLQQSVSMTQALGIVGTSKPVFLLHISDAFWFIVYPVSCIGGLQAWSPRVPEPGMGLRNLNLPSPSSLEKVGSFLRPISFSLPCCNAKTFTAFSQLSPQLWGRHFRHLVFLLHLTILLLVCDFRSTGPRDVILNVYSIFYLSLSLHEASPPDLIVNLHTEAQRSTSQANC